LKGGEAVIMTSATAIQPKKTGKTNDLSHKHALFKRRSKEYFAFLFCTTTFILMSARTNTANRL